MRIIAGQNRGLNLATPRGHEVRPILDRVRESLFSIIQHEIPDAVVADLFAGTGVIGLEALSRGAASCTFVDRDPACVATINENIRRAKRENESRVVRGDVFNVEQLVQPALYTLIFVDPPYRMLRDERHCEKVVQLIAALGSEKILAKDGVVVVRYPSDTQLPGRIEPLAQYDRRRYGGMKISLFKRTSPDSPVEILPDDPEE